MKVYFDRPRRSAHIAQARSRLDALQGNYQTLCNITVNSKWGLTTVRPKEIFICLHCRRREEQENNK